MRLSLFRQAPTKIATTCLLVSLFVITVTVSLNQPSKAQANKFFCSKQNGVPVTMVRTSRGNEPFLRWVVKDFKGFSPEKRCRIVAARFQRYYDNGSVFITARNNLNGYPVLCIANRKGGSCSPENVLVTLKPGTDTGRVLQQMDDFRRGSSPGPLELGGNQYITYLDGDLYFDVKQLVDSQVESTR